MGLTVAAPCPSRKLIRQESGLYKHLLYVTTNHMNVHMNRKMALCYCMQSPYHLSKPADNSIEKPWKLYCYNQSLSHTVCTDVQRKLTVFLLSNVQPDMLLPSLQRAPTLVVYRLSKIAVNSQLSEYLEAHMKYLLIWSSSKLKHPCSLHQGSSIWVLWDAAQDSACTNWLYAPPSLQQ